MMLMNPQALRPCILFWARCQKRRLCRQVRVPLYGRLCLQSVQTRSICNDNVTIVAYSLDEYLLTTWRDRIPPSDGEKRARYGLWYTVRRIAPIHSRQRAAHSRGMWVGDLHSGLHCRPPLVTRYKLACPRVATAVTTGAETGRGRHAPAIIWLGDNIAVICLIVLYFCARVQKCMITYVKSANFQVVIPPDARGGKRQPPALPHLTWAHGGRGGGKHLQARTQSICLNTNRRPWR